MQLPDGRDVALQTLSATLTGMGYGFVTVTPETHFRVLARKGNGAARNIVDVFGWSMPFTQELLPADMFETLRNSGMLEENAGAFRSRVRLSTVNGNTYLHSAFPTTAENAVFLGPDSYRFANLITDELTAHPCSTNVRIVDIGVGAGVGAVTAATSCRSARIVATDVNPQALRLARINAAAGGFLIETCETSGLEAVAGTFDVALLNPPYIMDDDGRAYRDGGGMHGGQLSLDLATEALGRLASGGRLILYTGSAIVNGADALKVGLRQAADAHGCELRYREIDPDVFGEELDNPQYADVERIALISAIFTRSR